MKRRRRRQQQQQQRRRYAPDLISQLPEPILQNILSFLAIKDAARMGTVSNTWNRAWKSLPSLNLNFGDESFHNEDYSPNLVNFVNQALAIRQNQKICVESFRLRFGWPYWSNPPFVDNWIKTVVACNVKDLYLTMTTYPLLDCYQLPKEIFDAKTLNVLHLRGCKIEFPSNRIIKFSSLRFLYLYCVILDENFIQAISTSCCNLEMFCLRGFRGISSIQFGETLYKLKKVELGFMYCPFDQIQKVDIRAPNLIDLELYQLRSHLRVFDITACKALTSLLLFDMVVTRKWVEDVSSNLPDLRYLYLESCKTLKTIKISSLRLHQLVVYDCNLINLELDTPNLNHFSYHCHSFATLKLIKASVLLEPEISFDDSVTPHSDWYSKFLIFLANFKHSKVVELSSKNDKVIVIPNDMRQELVPPLYRTDCLHVKVQNELKHSVADIVDSLLWISPQLDTLSFHHQTDLKTLKFIYEDASEEDEKGCCTSLTWKCWRHKLKQVKMQNFTCMEQQELRNLFLANPNLIIDEVVGPSGLGDLPRRSKRKRLPNQKLADYICGVGPTYLDRYG